MRLPARNDFTEYGRNGRFKSYYLNEPLSKLKFLIRKTPPSATSYVRLSVSQVSIPYLKFLVLLLSFYTFIGKTHDNTF